MAGCALVQVYQALSQQIEHSGFLEKLQRAKDAQASVSSSQIHGSEVLRAEWWKVPHGEDDATCLSGKEEAGFAEVHCSCHYCKGRILEQQLCAHLCPLPDGSAGQPSRSLRVF